MNIKEHFESKIYYSIDGCWYWLAYIKATGYGYFSTGNKSRRAHRVSYEIYVGPIPDDLIVCHSCDNPSCVNPDHLFLGTHKQNTHDMIRKGRNNPYHGETHPSAKLTEEQVIEILKLKGTMPIADIAERYSEVSVGAISGILYGRNWARVKRNFSATGTP